MISFTLCDRLAAYYEMIIIQFSTKKIYSGKCSLMIIICVKMQKSRPGFAGEYPVTKDAARAFYETERGDA